MNNTEKKFISSKSQKIKLLKKLNKSSERYKQKLFLIEGPQCTQEALKQHLMSGKIIIEIYYSSNGKTKFPYIFELALKTNLDLHQVTHETLNSVSYSNAHQGWILLCSTDFSNTKLVDVINAKTKTLIYLEKLRDPGNIGTIIRIADAINADGVLLGKECVDIYNIKVIRSTAGSFFNIPILQNFSFDAMFDLIKKYNIISIAADGHSKNNVFDYKNINNSSILWIFGNEAHGINDSTLRKVDEVLSIPIYGKAESLNVASAAAICLYAQLVK